MTQNRDMANPGIVVSQSPVIICKFPQKYLFSPGGGPLSKRSRVPEPLPARAVLAFIVRQTRVIICNSERK